MDTTNSQFIFDYYTIDSKKAQLHFFYKVITKDKTYDFIEKLSFPFPFPQIPQDIVQPFLQSLHIMLGISYWKTFCPEKIVLKYFTLTKEQAAFWNSVYTKGLGEFFYKNKIDFRERVQFPFDSNKKAPKIPHQVQDDKGKNRSLLPVGGGKDAIVVGEALKQAKKEVTVVIISHGKETKAQEQVVGEMGLPHFAIKRTIDPALLQLVSEGALNGHVPMVAMHSFICLFAALVYDYRYVVLANEESANHGNVEYFGEVMNHQWSKSLEFETLLAQYTATFLSKDITYFSLLRPFMEITIAKLFSKYPQYFGLFVSCNKGYAIAKKGKTHWCNACPKCAFVFVILSAYLSKEELVRIFKENLFDKLSLLPLFKALLGVQDFKPFECVGTAEEVAYSLLLAHEKQEWEESALMQYFAKDILPKMKPKKEIEQELFAMKEHRVPEEFKEILKQVQDDN